MFPKINHIIKVQQNIKNKINLHNLPIDKLIDQLMIIDHH